MRINSLPLNLMSFRLEQTQKALARSLERMSSGQGIARPQDDIARFATSVNLESQTRGLSAQIRGLNDARGLFATASVAVQAQEQILLRMRDLSVQAANGTLSTTQRQQLDSEMKTLLAELGRISEETEFNGHHLLNGFTSSLNINDRNIEFADLRPSELFRTTDTEPNSTSSSFGLTNGRSTNQFSGGVRGSVFLEIGDGPSQKEIFEYDEDGGWAYYDSENFSLQNAGFVSALSNADQISAVDLDLDGDDDIVILDTSAQQILVLNNSGGSFNETANLSLSISSNIAFSDHNTDGILDIIYGKGSDLMVSYLDGGLGDAGQAQDQTLSNDITRITTADFNGDGYDDLAVGLFNVMTTYLNVGSSYQEVASAALAGDIIDIVFDSSTFTLFASSKDAARIEYGGVDTSGVFSMEGAVEVNVTSDSRLFVGDSTGDGIIDLILSNSFDTSFMFERDNNGDIIETFEYEVPVSGLPGDYDDADNDGILDHLMIEGFGATAHYFFMGDYIAGSTVNTEYDVSALSELSLLTTDTASDTMEFIDEALERVQEANAQYANELSRLDILQSSMERQLTSLNEARSSLIDTDYALEASEAARLQVLAQVQMAAMTQANFQMQSVLELLVERGRR